MTTVRANVYESDPLTTFVDRIPASDTWSDYYEIPEALVAAYEAADQAVDEARAAVRKHIADNKLSRQDGVL